MVLEQPHNPVSVALVGIGGYGYYYLKTLLEKFPAGAVELRAAVDPRPQEPAERLALRDRNIPLFASLEQCYGVGNTVDLAVIVSPIHCHVPQSCTALRNGSHVLCEKPLAATVQDTDRLIDTRDATSRWVMIGYQWSYSKAIQRLKEEVRRGVFGKPIALKTLCFWPRTEDYYRRNDWAGKIKDGEGAWILDSPANNAMAHFLHNMLYLLGTATDRSAYPVEVTAELYRAYDIENYDSIACRIFSSEGVELLFYASHAIPADVGPIFCYEFEHATVKYDHFSRSGAIIAVDRQGREKSYGSPDDSQFLKLFAAVDSVRHTAEIVCGPEAARAQTLCVNGIQESAAEIVTFPRSMIRYDGAQRIVEDLAETFLDCYGRGILPGETGVPWAGRGRSIDLSVYRFFPGGSPGEA